MFDLGRNLTEDETIYEDLMWKYENHRRFYGAGSIREEFANFNEIFRGFIQYIVDYEEDDKNKNKKKQV
jgi:hypothetical protein